MIEHKTTIKLAAIFLIIIFILFGCFLIFKLSKNVVKNKPTIEDQLVAQSKIKKFNNYEDLKKFLEENPVGPNYGEAYGSRQGMEVMTPDSIPVGAEMMLNSVDTSEKLQSLDYSKTNIQVQGVDEPDIIKTDGKYIYAVVENNLFIINAYPTQNAEILSKIEFKSQPQNIYINGDNLIIYGQDDQIHGTELYKKFARHSNYVFFKVFDIKDKKNPKQIRDLNFEGSYSNSRMIGDYVYFITTNYNYSYIDNEPVLPRIIDNNKVLPNKCSGKFSQCFMPDVYYFDLQYDSYNFTTITAININDNLKPISGDVYIMSANQNMYVSQNNIYITYTKYINERELAIEALKEIIYPQLSEKYKNKIAKIEQTENFILNSAEKLQKISGIIELYKNSLNQEKQEALEKQLKQNMKQKYEDILKELEKTVIHKIAVNKDKLEYKTSGQVLGQVLNQFSMDESDGYFRIATTKNRTWSAMFEGGQNESYNNLYVLDDNLKVIGALEKLAETEKIYSARFMQNRAYLVTFRQTDPLFVIDLSDPTQPKALGELKVPGFSNYLHPYDDKILIGLGKDADESGQTKGLKLSLFDVSQIDNPKEIDTYVMGDASSDSIALHDHKAFLFSKDKNLLVIPVSIGNDVVLENDINIEQTNFPLSDNSLPVPPVPFSASRISPPLHRKEKLNFVGAAVFKVDENGFKLKGKIDHSGEDKFIDIDSWSSYQYYSFNVKRSLYIDDILYTFSNKYLKMNKLDDLGLVGSLEFFEK